MPKALVLSGHDLRTSRDEHARGAAPAALPYEVDALGRSGIDVVVRSSFENVAADRIRRKIEHRTGYSVAATRLAMAAVRSVDVVIGAARAS